MSESGRNLHHSALSMDSLQWGIDFQSALTRVAANQCLIASPLVLS
jgi:hypothetical protein